MASLAVSDIEQLHSHKNQLEMQLSLVLLVCFVATGGFMVSADSLVQISNSATLMLEASRCIDLLYDDAADDVEQAKCALSTRNILHHIRSTEDFT